METIFVLISPVIVALLTQGVKQLQAIKLSPDRIILVRTVVATLSFIVAILNVWINGGELDQSLVADFVDTTVGTVFFALIAHVLYKYTPEKIKELLTFEKK